MIDASPAETVARDLAFTDPSWVMPLPQDRLGRGGHRKRPALPRLAARRPRALWLSASVLALILPDFLEAFFRTDNEDFKKNKPLEADRTRMGFEA